MSNRATATGRITSRAAPVPAAAVLLAAADLMARGYAVYLPVNPSAPVDILALDRQDRVERVVVRRARRAGEEVRYDDVARAHGARRALILANEPVQYEPAMRKRSLE